MRKSYIVTLLAGAIALSAAAQSKFDAPGLMIMNQYERMKVDPNAKRLKVQMTPIDSEAMSRADSRVSVFVTLHDGHDASEIEALGFDILVNANRMVLASGTFEDIKALEECDFVKALSFGSTRQPMLDKSREVSNIDAIHEGTGLDKAYTGDGVIAGIYDNGVDPNHANFLTSLKKTRLGRLWEYQNTNGFATTYDTATKIAKFETDDKNNTHGTHTLGCMAGSFNRSGNGKVAIMNGSSATASSSAKNPYYAPAKEAELAVGCGKLNDPNVADAIQKIIDYAKDQKKPAVINLSLGSIIGPHDGSDAICQTLEELGKEAIICISAGNEGNDSISIDKTFTASDNSYKTFYHSYDNYEGVVEFWSSSSTGFTVTPFIYDLSSKSVVYEYNVTGDKEQDVLLATNERQGAGIIHNDAMDKAFTNSYVYVQTAKNTATNNRYQAYLSIVASYNKTTNANKNLVLGLKITGSAGQRVTATLQTGAGYDAIFRSLDQAGFVAGNSDFSINSIACAKTCCVSGRGMHAQNGLH